MNFNKKNFAKQGIYIIAELGINHDGTESVAFELIDLAHKAGVNAVKFQYRNVENTYNSASTEIGDEILSQEIIRTKLDFAQIIKLNSYARNLGLETGISFFAPQDIDDFGVAIQNFDFLKIPSPVMSNFELVNKCIEIGKHVFISTGAQTEQSIESLFTKLPEFGWTPMHCISNYPAITVNAKLGYIKYLSDKWQREVGYSSHDMNWSVCIAAIYSGAKIIERHITLDKTGIGLDHTTSSTYEEFKFLVDVSSNLNQLGSGDFSRTPNQGELINLQNLGKSLYAKEDIAMGSTLELDKFNVQSPQVGINLEEFNGINGKKTLRFIERNKPLSRSDIETGTTLTRRDIEFAKESKISLPARFHDYQMIKHEIPIENFELHLSHRDVDKIGEFKILSEYDKFSIHLPDYINSTTLFDPFAGDVLIKEASINIMNKIANFADKLQSETNSQVPIVGSFSQLKNTHDLYYQEITSMQKNFSDRGILVLPQWLPPYAWYFGGAVKLNIMNDMKDLETIAEQGIFICTDLSHLILSANYTKNNVFEMYTKLVDETRHLHLAGASGIDGEGLYFNNLVPDELTMFKHALKTKHAKVLEVWQGHLDNFEGFKLGIKQLSEVSHG